MFLPLCDFNFLSTIFVRHQIYPPHTLQILLSSNRRHIFTVSWSVPKLARYERVTVSNTNNEWIQPRTKHFLYRELFITHKTRIFIEIVFWTQIRNKNSLTIEPNANLKICMKCMRFTSDWLGKRLIKAIVDWLYFHSWKSCTPFWLAVYAFFTCENKAYRIVQMSLKCPCDKKTTSFFPSDFESVFDFYPKAVYFECKFWISRSAITHVQNWPIGPQTVGSREKWRQRLTSLPQRVNAAYYICKAWV